MTCASPATLLRRWTALPMATARPPAADTIYKPRVYEKSTLPVKVKYTISLCNVLRPGPGSLQGHLTYKKTHPPRTLPQAYA